MERSKFTALGWCVGHETMTQGCLKEDCNKYPSVYVILILCDCNAIVLYDYDVA